MPTDISTLYAHVRGTLLLLPWLTHLLFADILLSALLPISPLLPTQTYHLSSHIAYTVWASIQRLFTKSNHAEIIVSGVEDIPQGESAIVIANHVEWTDFYMIQEVAGRKGMLGRCRWFAKQQLKWVPFLGWGLWAMGMPLVSRRWTEDKREMDRVFKGVVERAWPVWLISYSEATRFTTQKRLEAEAWCRQNDKKLGEHLLYPRTKGFIACVQKLRTAPHIKAVYDFTIAYRNKRQKTFQKPPKFGQTIMTPDLSKEWQFYVHVDRFLLEKLPKEDAELARWLEERWVEKGQRLEKLRLIQSKGELWS